MRVRYVPRARAQLRRIGRYLAQDSPTAAQQVVARITDAVDGLATFPTMGRPGRVIGNGSLRLARNSAAAQQIRSGGRMSAGCDASLADPNGIGTHTRNARSATKRASSTAFRIRPL